LYVLLSGFVRIAFKSISNKHSTSVSDNRYGEKAPLSDNRYSERNGLLHIYRFIISRGDHHIPHKHNELPSHLSGTEVIR
jgi:hypothetical protein